MAMPAVWRETDERGEPGRLGIVDVTRIRAPGLLQRASVIRVQLPWVLYKYMTITL